MNRIIKDLSLVENDEWTIIHEESIQPSEIADKSILPFNLWLTHHEALSSKSVGVWLSGSTDPKLLTPQLFQLPLIALHLDVFTDGRAYSLATKLREEFKFTGEIRAFGDVLLDQLFYMQRCGINSYQLKNDNQYDEALSYFTTFNSVYQTSSNNKSSILLQRIKNKP